METEDQLRRRRAMQSSLGRVFNVPQNIGLNPPRQPMDERTPSGQTVNDLLRSLPSSPITPRAAPSAPAINVSATGLSLPQPAQPNINVGGIEPPQPSQPVATPASSPRIGYSTAGLTGVDRLLERRKALEEADPESRVTPTGEILPPQKTGRLRGAGQLGLLGLGQGDPNHPLYSLGQGVGGAITGLISPRSAAKAQRQFDLSQLDTDLARGLKLEGMQQEVRGPKWGQMSTRVVGEGEYPDIEAGTEIRVRLDPRTGAVTDVVGPNNRPVIADLGKRTGGAPHYESDADGYLITVQGGRAERVTDPNGQPVKVKSKNAQGEVVEVEVNGQRLKVTPGQALGYYGQVGERAAKRDEAQAEREAKYNTAKSEYDSLITAEEEARKQKDAAYKTLDSMRTSGQPKEDVDAAQRAAVAADQFYRSFGEKKKDAARRMGENQVSTTPTTSTQPYAGRTMSAANLARYAKDKGISEDEARKQVEAQGVRIQ